MDVSKAFLESFHRVARSCLTFSRAATWAFSCRNSDCGVEADVDGAFGHDVVFGGKACFFKEGYTRS